MMRIFWSSTNRRTIWTCGPAIRSSVSLTEFDGTVLLVSHDRYFLNRVVDHLLVVEPGRFRVIEGNYDTYLHLVAQGLAGGEDAVADAEEKSKAAAKHRHAAKKRPGRNGSFPIARWRIWRPRFSSASRASRPCMRNWPRPRHCVTGSGCGRFRPKSSSSKRRVKSLYPHWEEASELN